MKLFAIIILAGSAGLAHAQSVLFTVSLDGGQEVPSVSTSGFGFGSLLLNTNTGAINYSITYSNLTGLSSLMHIHQAPLGVNGSVIYNFDNTVTPGGDFFPILQADDVIGSGFVPLSEVGNMLAGNTYVNIHSSAHDGGEIRGQLYVPEPTVAALTALGGLAIAAGRRRI